jgi:hypothetical protein
MMFLLDAPWFAVPESEWQTPHATTRIRTLPGLGACIVFSVSPAELG